VSPSTAPPPSPSGRLRSDLVRLEHELKEERDRSAELRKAVDANLAAHLAARQRHEADLAKERAEVKRLTEQLNAAREAVASYSDIVKALRGDSTEPPTAAHQKHG
jgi:chromosome segregation ATPase